jgi:uncharacterized membrane protein YfcA
MSPIPAVQTALGAMATLFAIGWGSAMRTALRKSPAPRSAAEDARFPSALQIGVGFATNFLDTLGIGSYATTTAMFRLRKIVNDRIIPGTLTVGHALPTIVETFLFLTIVRVDVPTLLSMIGAAILGAWLGAGVVARWPKYKVQIGMGVALLVAASLMFMAQMNLFPGGGEALGVRGVKFVMAVFANFALGALMTLGIGLYAPCMITVSLLGMNPKAAFPIMMASCAFLMPVGSVRFIREKSYSMRPALGLAIGGIPGVVLAVYAIKELSIYWVRWLVIAVVIYTATTMLYAAFRENRTPAAEATVEA